MKVAIVHDWLIVYCGAERVLSRILALFPEADLFSLMDFLPEQYRPLLLGKKSRTSFMQHLPFARDRYRSFLPLMPLAARSLDVSGYDLVISSSYAVAKGVRTGKDQVHVCYCHSPARYVWEKNLREQYLREAGLDRGLKKIAANAVLDRIRDWDKRTAAGVNHFIAVSDHIAERIKRAYGREARVIYPPVDTAGFFAQGEQEKQKQKQEKPGGDNFYLAASRMVPYKKMDLIAETFAQLGLPLVMIGDGPDLEKIRAKTGGKIKNIEVLGWQPDEVLKDYLRRARAFVFAAQEDFGIIPVEAQACGTPVIAYGKGGALETVVKDRTGIFFYRQDVESLKEAVLEFEDKRTKNCFDPALIRENALRFGVERFEGEFRAAIRDFLGAN